MAISTVAFYKAAQQNLTKNSSKYARFGDDESDLGKLLNSRGWQKAVLDPVFGTASTGVGGVGSYQGSAWSATFFDVDNAGDAAMCPNNGADHPHTPPLVKITGNSIVSPDGQI